MSDYQETLYEGYGQRFRMEKIYVLQFLDILQKPKWDWRLFILPSQQIIQKLISII